MMNQPGAVLLVSCYELGRQPLSIASPGALLHEAGYTPATLDLAVERARPERIAAARIAAIAVPMHTALRLGVRVAARIRELNPGCHICFFGHYAMLNAESLLDDGLADSVIAGEYEEPLVRLVESLQRGDRTAVPGVRTADHAAGPWIRRIRFAVPRRDGLPPLERYARLQHDGSERIAGQVEASRGCLHRCRHCPIPPVYGGRFFVVPREIVLADIRNQVAAGATHITFGDADFLNGPGHALDVVRAMHAEFPRLTFDVTVKISHLLQHAGRLGELARAGCLFIVSAVESLNNEVLSILDKGHTRADVVTALSLTRNAGIALRPSLVPFTPWSDLQDYRELLEFIAGEQLIDYLDPVQLSIRLLIPPGSLLAVRPEVRDLLGPLDRQRFTFTWNHSDPRMDRLQQDVSALVEAATANAVSAGAVFDQIVERVDSIEAATPIKRLRLPTVRKPPRLTEPWFC